jgi:flagellar protein FliS
METAYDRYLEAEVLSADPLKLVWLLYRGAIDAVRSARASLEQADIRGRVRQINRAWAILQELAGCLNHASGGEISQRLAGLYSYMQTRLIEANTQQSAAPLEDVENLLLTLVEAWSPAALQAVSHAVTRAPDAGQEYDTERVALAVG